MMNQQIPKCKTCGEKASISGQLFTTVSEIMDIPSNGYLCGNCFKTSREAEKEHIADQAFLKEEEYEREEQYKESNR